MEREELVTLGTLLRRQREEQGLTQEALAEAAGAGLSVDTISNIERGRVRPYRQTLEALLDALELDQAEREAVSKAWRLARRTRGSDQTLPVRQTVDLPPSPTAPGSGPQTAALEPRPAKSEAPSVPPAVSRAHSRLPVAATPLVGRGYETSVVCEMLRGEVRLVTLTGVGGTGKTRLALQVAAELEGSFPDGVAYAALAMIDDPVLVPVAIEQTLGLRDTAGATPLERLATYLQPKQLLLVLDNLEQVLSAASIIGDLLAAAPGLKVLATSRVTLRLYGEHEYRVPPLAVSVPHSGDSLASPAVELFMQRARAVKTNMDTTPETLQAVAAICAALDGLPLAIELAAARIKLFSPRAMLTRLPGDALHILTGGARDRPERQQTLRRTLDWSYDLLDPPDRRLFARLGAFAGEFGVEAVASVCEGESDALERMADLADAGLLEYAPAEEPRFRLLETVREYAQARLAESGQEGGVRRRHAAYYLDLAERAEPHLRGPEQVRWATRLDQERANLRAALGCLLDNDPLSALRMAVALEWYWARHGGLTEGRGWLEATLERAGDRGPRRAQALVALGSILEFAGDYKRADAHLEEGLSLHQELGDLRGMAAAKSGMGMVSYHRGDLSRSRAHHEEALALYRQLGDRWGMARALHGLGAVRMMQGDLEGAAALFEESGALFREVGDDWSVANTGMHLGGVAFFRGEHERAIELHRATVTLSQGLGDVVLAGRSATGLALALAAVGEPDRAARLWAAARALQDRVGVPVAALMRAATERFVADIRARLDDQSWEVAVAEGRAMSLEEAIELALDG